jgi:cytochrome c
MKIQNTFKLLSFCGLVLIVIFGILACTEGQGISTKSVKTEGRWYDLSQVELGETVYQKNCISCHLENAQGVLDWKKTLDDGSYPPPPLNGTAHAWHHSIEVLLTVINDGGIPYGGKMPAFINILTQEQKLAVIAYFQSFWPEETYTKWEAMQK